MSNFCVSPPLDGPPCVGYSIQIVLHDAYSVIDLATLLGVRLELCHGVPPWASLRHGDTAHVAEVMNSGQATEIEKSHCVKRARDDI